MIRILSKNLLARLYFRRKQAAHFLESKNIAKIMKILRISLVILTIIAAGMSIYLPSIGYRITGHILLGISLIGVFTTAKVWPSFFKKW